MFARKAGAFMSVAPFKSSTLGVGLQTNVGIGWKGLQGTDTLAYYKQPEKNVL
jgi:hypothetical protein